MAAALTHERTLLPNDLPLSLSALATRQLTELAGDLLPSLLPRDLGAVTTLTALHLANGHRGQKLLPLGTCGLLRDAAARGITIVERLRVANVGIAQVGAGHGTQWHAPALPQCCIATILRTLRIVGFAEVIAPNAHVLRHRITRGFVGFRGALHAGVIAEDPRYRAALALRLRGIAARRFGDDRKNTRGIAGCHRRVPRISGPPQPLPFHHCGPGCGRSIERRIDHDTVGIERRVLAPGDDLVGAVLVVHAVVLRRSAVLRLHDVVALRSVGSGIGAYPGASQAETIGFIGKRMVVDIIASIVDDAVRPPANGRRQRAAIGNVVIEESSVIGRARGVTAHALIVVAAVCGVLHVDQLTDGPLVIPFAIAEKTILRRPHFVEISDTVIRHRLIGVAAVAVDGAAGIRSTLI